MYGLKNTVVFSPEFPEPDSVFLTDAVSGSMPVHPDAAIRQSHAAGSKAVMRRKFRMDLFLTITDSISHLFYMYIRTCVGAVHASGPTTAKIDGAKISDIRKEKNKSKKREKKHKKEKNFVLYLEPV